MGPEAGERGGEGVKVQRHPLYGNDSRVLPGGLYKMALKIAYDSMHLLYKTPGQKHKTLLFGYLYLDAFCI